MNNYNLMVSGERSDKAVERRLLKGWGQYGAQFGIINKAYGHAAEIPGASIVSQRIRILMSNIRQHGMWAGVLRLFSKKLRQNVAELEALIQYGQSGAVWEIAYLRRKQAARKLDAVEKNKLEYLRLFHDSPDVLRITELRLKADQDTISFAERQELTALQRNPYRKGGIPGHLLEMLWPPHTTRHLDVGALR